MSCGCSADVVGTPADLSPSRPRPASRDWLRLTDPAARGDPAKLGSCNGDSGSPVFAVRGGMPVLVGIVSRGNCGDDTVAIPLAPHLDWITETARSLGAPLAPELAESR
jgi:secreted trypsin-like serine protease